MIMQLPHQLRTTSKLIQTSYRVLASSCQWTPIVKSDLFQQPARQMAVRIKAPALWSR